MEMSDEKLRRELRQVLYRGATIRPVKLWTVVAYGDKSGKRPGYLFDSIVEAQRFVDSEAEKHWMFPPGEPKVIFRR